MIPIIRYLPDQFFNLECHKIHTLFDRPTLIHLPGEKEEPLFISTLLHGNETSSLTIIQNVFRNYPHGKLPRSVVILIGNPKACAQGLRHLENQLDFNRIWRGGNSYEHMMAKDIIKYLTHNNVYASIDLHNNSGKNPVYACVNRRKNSALRLAQCFSNKVVYFTEPNTTLSVAMADHCPSITVECSLSGDTEGITKGAALIERVLKDETWLNEPIRIKHVYSTFATLYISQDAQIDFKNRDDDQMDFSLRSDFDELNFQEVEKNIDLGYTFSPKKIKLINKNGENIIDQFFTIENNKLICLQGFTASMFTKNIDIAKSDCLGYTMFKMGTIGFK